MTNSPNIENINKVISLIKGEIEARFDMCAWLDHNGEYAGNNSQDHFCGTAACIGGFALIAKAGSFSMATSLESRDAMDYLGLSSDDMFYARDDNSGMGVKLTDVSLSDAINVLEQFRDTGTYSWKFHKGYCKKIYFYTR